MLQYVRMALSPASSLYYRETEMPDPDICDNLPDLVAGYHSSSEAESCPLQQSFTSQPKASRCCDRLVAGQSAAIRRYTVLLFLWRCYFSGDAISLEMQRANTLFSSQMAALDVAPPGSFKVKWPASRNKNKTKPGSRLQQRPL